MAGFTEVGLWTGSFSEFHCGGYLWKFMYFADIEY